MTPCSPGGRPVPRLDRLVAVVAGKPAVSGGPPARTGTARAPADRSSRREPQPVDEQHDDAPGRRQPEHVGLAGHAEAREDRGQQVRQRGPAVGGRGGSRGRWHDVELEPDRLAEPVGRDVDAPAVGDGLDEGEAPAGGGLVVGDAHERTAVGGEVGDLDAQQPLDAGELQRRRRGTGVDDGVGDQLADASSRASSRCSSSQSATVVRASRRAAPALRTAPGARPPPAARAARVRRRRCAARRRTVESSSGEASSSAASRWSGSRAASTSTARPRAARSASSPSSRPAPRRSTSPSLNHTSTAPGARTVSAVGRAPCWTPSGRLPPPTRSAHVPSGGRSAPGQVAGAGVLQPARRARRAPRRRRWRPPPGRRATAPAGRAVRAPAPGADRAARRPAARPAAGPSRPPRQRPCRGRRRATRASRPSASGNTSYQSPPTRCRPCPGGRCRRPRARAARAAAPAAGSLQQQRRLALPLVLQRPLERLRGDAASASRWSRSSSVQVRSSSQPSASTPNGRPVVASGSRAHGRSWLTATKRSMSALGNSARSAAASPTSSGSPVRRTCGPGDAVCTGTAVQLALRAVS